MNLARFLLLYPASMFIFKIGFITSHEKSCSIGLNIVFFHLGVFKLPCQFLFLLLQSCASRSLAVHDVAPSNVYIAYALYCFSWYQKSAVYCFYDVALLMFIVFPRRFSLSVALEGVFIAIDVLYINHFPYLPQKHKMLNMFVTIIKPKPRIDALSSLLCQLSSRLKNRTIKKYAIFSIVAIIFNAYMGLFLFPDNKIQYVLCYYLCKFKRH